MQKLLVLILIGAAIGFMVRRAVMNRKGGNCGCGSNKCGSSKVKDD